MSITHNFVSAKPPAADPTEIGSVEWNAAHTVDIVNADVNAAAAIAESKLALTFATHAALTIGTASGLSLVAQALSLGLASAGVTGALSGADWSTFNGKQAALTFPLASTLGGTGVSNAGTLTNASNTTITGGGTVALGGFTLTVPATLIVAGLAVQNVFTVAQQIDVPTATVHGLTLKSTDGTDTNYLIRAVNNADVAQWGLRRGPTIDFFVAGAVAGSFQMSSGHLKFTGGSGADVQFIADATFQGAINFTGMIIGGVNNSIPDSTVKLHLRQTTATTNAIAPTLRLEAIVSSTGVAAAGFGTSAQFYAETATNGTNQQQGQIATTWIDATNATRKAKMSLSAYDTAARLGIEIEASGTVVKIGLFGGTTAIQQVLNAYTSDGEGAAYTGVDNLQVGAVYATVADLNQLRVAYETLRASYDDLRTKLQTSTLVA